MQIDLLCTNPVTHKLQKGWITENYATPFNYYWTVEIKNKERQSHISIADRFTETVINRTRRAIDILLRNHDSAESKVVEVQVRYSQYSNCRRC